MVDFRDQELGLVTKWAHHSLRRGKELTQKGIHIHITGVVQGVGFRPFVFNLAERFKLNGWVQNTSAGVDIEVDGSPDVLENFTKMIQSEAPPLAQIDSFEVTDRPSNGFEEFRIIHSAPIAGAFQPISPDVSICPDCLQELRDPTDRRFRYPFINCTNCGPRFTIITDIPYDRPNTTMAPFEMCPQCAAEYDNPHDRRFHAQPVACPVCGPHIWLQSSTDLDSTSLQAEAALQRARFLLRQGKVVAIKGLGGFHLACDATNDTAVTMLRKRKLRVEKPFAIMMADIESVERHCLVNEAERRLLISRQRPIVIMYRRPGSTISRFVAPGQQTIGVMLPYTPLHYLLLEQEDSFPEALVMTSGNISEEPIATKNDEALERLKDLADAFLMHNRKIRTRCDDSVVRTINDSSESDLDAIYPIRRSRGYAPYPLHLTREFPQILATGAELKNAFCLTNGHYAFLSHHIGDMENYETLKAFEDGITHMERLFKVKPEFLAYDLHPNYLATRYALSRAEKEGLPAVGVQHHHAHIAACMTEHGLQGESPIIGFAFDGTGFGDDGAIWGGEVLIANCSDYERAYHLNYIPLIGGELAIKEPWRLALAWLSYSGLDWDEDLPPVKAISGLATTYDQKAILKNQLVRKINTPPTSSMGRLFDAVSSLIGLRQEVNYEAQAAIELEAIVETSEGGFYPWDFDNDQIDAGASIRSIVSDWRAGVGPSIIAARFHNTIAEMVTLAAIRLRSRHGIHQVALSGGVWQNMTLLTSAESKLCNAGFDVYIHQQVPANDGGVALGQAAVSAYQIAQL